MKSTALRAMLTCCLAASAVSCASNGSATDPTTASSAAITVAETTVATAAEPTTTELPTTAASADAEPTGSSADADADADAGRNGFSVGIGEPPAIDPGLAQDVDGAQVTRLMFVPLVRLDPELNVVPGVASEWSVAEDGLTWTFELDPDATYSDGRPVVADDFVHAFARLADPDFEAVSAYQGLPIAGWADVNGAEPSGEIGDVEVAGVTAVDDSTLTISTEAPFGLLPKVLTYVAFAPIPRDFVADDDAAATFADYPVGNGPYMMGAPWDHGNSISLVRNPNFAGEPGIADTITFQIYTDSQLQFAAFEAGDLDIARGLTSNALATVQNKYADRFVSTATGTLTYIGFPTNIAPYDNPDIRRALSLAINRDTIATGAFASTQRAATGMVPSQVPGALQETCDACTFDPVLAKQLWDAAGGLPGNTMVVYDIADDGTGGLDPILTSWRETFGIEIEVRSFEFGEYLDETAPGKPVGPFELGWSWDYPSGYSFLSPLFESTSDINNLLWSNSEFDALLKSARTAPTEVAGLTFLTEAQSIVEAEMPMAPILFANDLGVYSERLSNVLVDATGIWRLELVEVAD